ncbi:MAG: DsbA family protein [Asticcacaulis sp.]
MTEPDTSAPETSVPAAAKPGFFDGITLREKVLIGLTGTALVLSGVAVGQNLMFEQRARTWLVSQPEVIEEAVQALTKKREMAEKENATKALATHAKAIFEDPRDPILGNPKAPITVVEFFDYNCGYCKVALPELQKILKDNPDVKIVMKEMPIFGAESDTLAKAALAANVLGRYESVHMDLMTAKPASVETLMAALSRAGLSFEEIKAVAERPEIAQHLADNHALSEKLMVTGTPAFVVGDHIITGANIPALKEAIKARREALKKASPQG